MFTGKYHIGKPIISVSDGQRLGTLKDLYVDLELTQVVGVSLGSEGLFSRKELCIERNNVLVFGVDAILVKQDDVIVDGAPTCELGTWLRRDQLPGRQIATSGGTLVGTVDDIILDDETRIVGFRLGRVFVKGPVAENRAIVREAIIDVGDEERMLVDLGVAERQSLTAE
jgi:uncharacterized protein YrrD